VTKDALEVVERSIAFLIMVSGAVVVFIKMFDYLKARDKERSVGALKIAEFIEKFMKVDKDISELQINDENQNDKITRLQNDKDEMMKTLWNFLRK
jgi:hypothetical protein